MFDFIAEDQLDFHVYTSLLPYDIKKLLEEFLEDSYINGKKQVLIITGKGKVVRPIVQKLLASNRYVESYNSAGYYNGQQGAFEVNLVNKK